MGTLSFALTSCHLLLLLPCDYLKIVQGWRASSESKIMWIYSLPLSTLSSSPFYAYSSSFFFYLHSVIPLPPIISLTVTSHLNLIHPFFFLWCSFTLGLGRSVSSPFPCPPPPLLHPCGSSLKQALPKKESVSLNRL